MFKLKTATIVATLAMAAIPALVAPASAQVARASAIVAQDHAMRASKLMGMTIYNEKGDVLGKIADIMVKDMAAEPTVIVMTAGNAPKTVAMPMSHVHVKDDKITVGMTMAEMSGMPVWTFSGLAGGGG